MDHPVHGTEEVVKLLLGVKSECCDSLVHVFGGGVADILSGVVVVGHLGIVGVVHAEVGVTVRSQVSNF